MLLTAQQKLEFRPEDQAAMDRRFRNYVINSLPQEALHGLCCVGLDESASDGRPRRKLQQQPRHKGEQIGDGALKDEEKDALRTLPTADVWTDALDEIGETAPTADDG